MSSKAPFILNTLRIWNDQQFTLGELSFPLSNCWVWWGFDPLLSINELTEMILSYSVLKKQDIGQVSLNRDI